MELLFNKDDGQLKNISNLVLEQNTKEHQPQMETNLELLDKMDLDRIWVHIQKESKKEIEIDEEKYFRVGIPLMVCSGVITNIILTLIKFPLRNSCTQNISILLYSLVPPLIIYWITTICCKIDLFFNKQKKPKIKFNPTNPEHAAKVIAYLETAFAQKQDTIFGTIDRNIKALEDKRKSIVKVERELYGLDASDYVELQRSRVTELKPQLESLSHEFAQQRLKVVEECQETRDYITSLSKQYASARAIQEIAGAEMVIEVSKEELEIVRCQFDELRGLMVKSTATVDGICSQVESRASAVLELQQSLR